MDERRSNSVLRARIKELEFTSHVLRVQQEVSLDGILVVDSDWNMVSFNQRFVDMWQIPQRILDSKDDRKSINTVLDKLEDPESFLAKVEYLMAHPAEKSRDVLELCDGQYFERYSAPIFDRKNQNAGRVWFFRDITEIKESQKRLQEQNQHLEEYVQQRTSQLKKVNEELIKSRQACISHQEELANRNMGLVSLLESLEVEKEFLEQKMTANFRKSLIPLFEQLKESRLGSSEQHLVETIEYILSDISSSLSHSMENNSDIFTPTEVKVATFIKAGKTTKEISAILNSSSRTIEGHRLSIRKKFGLKSGSNLRVFLQNLQ
ncbi:MAG: hypothetical protein DSY80_08305 [Desulfocapsa sp.]|nr:MAG: hypothetical protein DSY80_08305 [Desulfocapsa sp.]